MAKFINNQGIIIEAIQWDGTEKSAMEIFKKFNAVFIGWDEPENIAVVRYDAHLRIKPYDYVGEQECGLQVFSSDYVAKHLRPITDARALVVEELKKEMLLKLAEKQATKKDDWRKKEFYDLQKKMHKKHCELSDELVQIIIESDTADFGKARLKCADMANYAAMIHDKLNAMELQIMMDKRRKSVSASL